MRMRRIGTPSLARGVRTLFGITGRRRRLQLVATIVLTLLGALAELFTIGAVVPLLALAADPKNLAQWPVFMTALTTLTPRSDNLMLPAAAILAIAATFSGVIRLALLWISHNFVHGLQYDLGT